GQSQPASARERAELALFSSQYKRKFVRAANWYAEAFAAEPKLAEEPPIPRRYYAAVAAAAAGCGQGKDAEGLSDDDRAGWRQGALEWLREELTFRRRQIDEGTPDVRGEIRQFLGQWQADPNLAGVSAEAGLAKLPADEQEAWRKLWHDVAD